LTGSSAPSSSLALTYQSDWPACRHYHRVPKEFEANKAWRKKLANLGASSAENARIIRQMCADDLLFFVNSFVIIKEPRRRGARSRNIAFVTYPFQDWVMTGIRDAIGVRDVGMEKSRDMGATWMVLTVFVWFWLFHRECDFMVMSRNEKLVDMTGNPDTLFSKIDHIIALLPGWIRPQNIERNSLHIKNLDNGSVIDGTSNTGDAGRGGRRLAFLIDEHAAFDLSAGLEVLDATMDVTETRIYLSTVKEVAGGFDQQMARNDPFITKFHLHWQVHPNKRRGLYTSENGKLKILDESFKYPAEYPFILDGRLRSIAYDKAWARRRSDDQIAREWDISRAESGSRVFDNAMLNRLIATTCQRPTAEIPLRVLLEGEMFGDVQTTEAFWKRCDSSTLKLWVQRDGYGNVARDRLYYMGVDVSLGTGASNSSIGVWDGRTGEKVAEYTWHHIEPNELAIVADRIAWMFQGHDEQHTRLIWEAKGPGKQFGRHVDQRGLFNVYRRRNEFSYSRKETDTPGWEPTVQNKLDALSQYATALKTGKATNRSAEALEDCRGYIHTNGGIDHVNSLQAQDPTGAKANHGDRAIADALAVHLMLDVRETDPEEGKVFAYGSAGWRREQYLQSKRQDREQTGSWWSRSDKQIPVWGARQ